MSTLRRVGVITGFASETRVAQMLAAEAGLADRVKLACAGASSQRAQAHAQTMLAEGVGALISFGIAGGLDPALRPGDVVLPDAVFTPEHHLLPCSDTWLTGLRTRAGSLGIGLHPGRLAGSDSACSLQGLAGRQRVLAMKILERSNDLCCCAFDGGCWLLPR